MKKGRSGRSSLVWVAALYLACAAPVLAADITYVESILDYPESFNRQVVTLAGTAKG